MSPRVQLHGGLPAQVNLNRPSKFPAVHSLTLFFPSNAGEDTTRVSFVGFKGEYTPLAREPPSNIVYESKARLFRASVVMSTDW